MVRVEKMEVKSAEANMPESDTGVSKGSKETRKISPRY